MKKKCDNCDKPATIHLTEIVGGEKTERHLCGDCAAEAGITIKAEIPGVKKEDVSVELRDNVLTLKGFRADDEDIEEDEYYRRERCFGLFHRSFTLESAINPDSIKARFESGVLEVKVPKPEKVKPESITVNIE
jgi:HSP20 family protein